MRVVDQLEPSQVFYSRMERDPRLLFGGHPTVAQFEHLKRIGVRYIIDLTTPWEKKRLPVYDYRGVVYVNFPIQDNSIPYDVDLFEEFMLWLLLTIDVMKNGERMYIHCKGGHGRSGMVMCCVLCAMYNLGPERSIQEVSKSHRERPVLSVKWRDRVCPSNEGQRAFVHRVYNTTKSGMMSVIKNEKFCSA